MLKFLPPAVPLFRELPAFLCEIPNGIVVEVRTVVSESIICERAFEFGRRILKLSDKLATRGFGGRHVAGQLVKCGTSIGANADESQEAQTKADFIAKLSVSRKEAKESGYWLRLAIAAQLVTIKEVEWELDEANQLLKMIRSAIVTAQSSARRGRTLD